MCQPKLHWFFSRPGIQINPLWCWCDIPKEVQTCICVWPNSEIKRIPRIRFTLQFSTMAIEPLSFWIGFESTNGNIVSFVISVCRRIHNQPYLEKTTITTIKVMFMIQNGSYQHLLHIWTVNWVHLIWSPPTTPLSEAQRDKRKDVENTEQRSFRCWSVPCPKNLAENNGPGDQNPGFCFPKNWWNMLGWT